MGIEQIVIGRNRGEDGMKEAIRSYHMFLPRTWVKWCIYLLYPLLVIGGMYAACSRISMLRFLCIGFAGTIIVGVEYMLDGFVFAGIASKNTNRLEYLKTSVKGIPLLKKALVMDGIRRMCSIVLILLSFYPMLYREQGINGSQLLSVIAAYALFVFLMVEIGLAVLRFFINVNGNLLAIYVVGALVCLVGLFARNYSIQGWQVLLLAIADIVVAVVARKIILERARDSYYDSRMEKMH